MEPRRPDLHHSAGDDLLAGYALGILTPAEQTELEHQLAVSPELRSELALLTVAVEALPLGLEPHDPSPALRDRLQAAVHADLTATQPHAVSRPAPQPPIRLAPRSRSINAWALAAVALLIIATAAVLWGLQQTRQADVPAQVIAFEMTDPTVPGTGQIAYLEEDGILLVTMEGLPPLPEDRVYEFWLIPHDGEPIPAGAFGDTSVRHALAGRPEDYQAVALTIEPGPLGTVAPTTDPVAVAPLTPDGQ